MPHASDDADDAERLVAHAERDRAAWQRTLEELESLADARRADGWDVVRVAADDAAAVPRDAGGDDGDGDYYGFVHVIPDNRAAPFEAAYERGAYPRYEVYRGATETRLFLVTELVDPEVESAILLAGNVRRRDARGLVRTVRETATVYTHVRTLDGTHLGSFEHADPGKFFPDADLRGRASTGDG